MTETVDYGRLWFSPWQMHGDVEDTVLSLIRRLGFGAKPQIRKTTSHWYEIYAEGPGVEGLLVDPNGLVADAEDVLAAMDPVFHQNIPLTCRGIRYAEDAIISSTMTMNRVAGVLSCTIERQRSILATGERQILINQTAQTGQYENVLQLKVANY